MNLSNSIHSSSSVNVPPSATRSSKRSVIIETIVAIAASIFCFVSANKLIYQAPLASQFLRLAVIPIGLFWLFRRIFTFNSGSGSIFARRSSPSNAYTPATIPVAMLATRTESMYPAPVYRADINTAPVPQAQPVYMAPINRLPIHAVPAAPNLHQPPIHVAPSSRQNIKAVPAAPNPSHRKFQRPPSNYSSSQNSHLIQAVRDRPSAPPTHMNAAPAHRGLPPPPYNPNYP